MRVNGRGRSGDGEELGRDTFNNTRISGREEEGCKVRTTVHHCSIDHLTTILCREWDFFRSLRTTSHAQKKLPLTDLVLSRSAIRMPITHIRPPPAKSPSCNILRLDHSSGCIHPTGIFPPINGGELFVRLLPNWFIKN